MLRKKGLNLVKVGYYLLFNVVFHFPFHLDRLLSVSAHVTKEFS